MPIRLHNAVWERVRLVQVETLPRHIAGVLANMRETLANSDCAWEDIYSAHYNAEDDGTTTFYEGENAEADKPGLWTYAVYACELGQEEVITNLELDTLNPALKLRRIFADVTAAIDITSPTEQAQALSAIATQNGIAAEALLASNPEHQQHQPTYEFDRAVNYVLEKNAELYRRLA